MVIRLRGTTGVLVAAVLVVFLLIEFPAYRLFLGISVLIGLAIAGVLTWWYRTHPIKETEVENKRPLGL